MKIEKIEYSKNYNIQGMQWEKIVMGGTLEEGESEMDAIAELRKKCDQSAQQMVNSLYQEQPLYSPTETKMVDYLVERSTTQTEEKLTPEQEVELIITSIEACENITQLNEYQLIAAKSNKTMGAFNKRKKQLNIN